MQEEKIYIEPMTKDELAILRELSVATFYDSFIWGNSEANMQDYIGRYLSTEKLATELADPNSSFYFAKINQTPVGYLKINTGRSQTELKADKTVEIERIYVDSKFQGRRIGQLLFNKAVDIARQQNADYLWLGVWEKNEGAIRFYERNGLVKFSTHPFALGDDIQTDIMMKLEL